MKLGTSKNTRALAALDPGWLAIDDRQPRELLAQAARLAQLFTYVDRAGAPAGRWDPFYTRVPLIRYALLAERRPDVADVKLQHALNKIGPEIDLGDDGHLAAAWNIINGLLADYLLVDDFARAFAGWPDEWRFAAALKEAIEPRLARDCRAVLECANWLLRQNRRPPFTLKGWIEADEALTSGAMGQNGWEDAPSGTRIEGALDPSRDFVHVLSSAAWSTLGIVTELVHQAGEHFEWHYNAPKSLPPHAGLLLAFVRQFSAAQAEMNRIPGEHCAFFFNSVLRAQRAPPRPDHVFVAFAAAPGQRAELPAGTTLVAGKDSAGQPVLYETLAPVSVASATVASVATLWLEDAGAAGRSGRTGGFHLVPPFAPPAAPEAKSWATFGEAPGGGRESTPETAVGFAVSSPVLQLEEGRRHIRITFRFAAPAADDRTVELPADHPWRVDYTASTGWAPVATPKGRLVASEKDGAWTPKTFGLELELSRGDPPCVNGAKVHGNAYLLVAAPAPFVRVHFPEPGAAFGREPSLAHAVARATVERVTIDVAAEGIEDLVLTSPSGKLAAGKPGPVFGSPPLADGRLVIGQVELFRKQLQSLELELDWVGLPTNPEDYPNGLRDAYLRYLPAVLNPPATMFRNDQYRVKIFALSSGAWQRIDATVVAPATPPPGPFLFDWAGAESAAPSGPLLTSRRIAVDPAAFATVAPRSGLSGPLEFTPAATTGFLAVQLDAPDYLFGAALYPAAVSAAALENARTLVGAAMSHPGGDDASEKPLGGYAAIRFPKAPSFFARPLARLKIKVSRWYTFHPRIFPELARMKIPRAVAEAAEGAGVSDLDLRRGLPRLHDDVFKDETGCRQRIADQLRLAWPASEAGNTCIDAVIHWFAKLAGRGTPDSGELAVMPPPPIVPTAIVRIARYTAQAVIEPGRGHNSAAAAVWDRLWQISPFAIYPLPEASAPLRPSWTPLLPGLNPGGSLYLGLSGNLPVERAFPTFPLSLLFVLEAAPRPNSAAEAVAPRWSYLAQDTWRDLPDSAIHDGTYGFRRSGIVRLDQPAEIDAGHATMPEGFYWLRASVPDPALRLRTLRVLPYGTEAAWRIPAPLTDEDAASHFAAPLPPGSITALAVPRPAIPKVLQPLPGFDGVPPENLTAFNCRISERLRHKGRAVAPADYEQLLLQQFPGIFFARAFVPAAPSEAGTVKIIVLPTVREPPAAPPPGFVPGELTAMEKNLQAVAPLSATVCVGNPDYDRVVVEVQVNFAPDDVWTAYAQKLNEDLKAVISPWIYRQADCAGPLLELRASEVTHHLRTRLSAYVTAVGLCRVWLESERGGRGETVRPTGRGRLLLSAAQHEITPLQLSAA